MGTCLAGGRWNLGAVFAFDARTDTETELASLGAVAPQPLYGVIQARDGDYYGIEDFGRSNVVFEVTPSAGARVLHDFLADTPGALVQALGPLVQGSDGDLYGVALGGGTGGGGAVFRIDPANGALTIVHAFSDASGSRDAYPIDGLGLGRNGWLYGAFSYPRYGLFVID